MDKFPFSEKSNKPQTPYLSSTTQQPSSSDHTGMSEIARYLVRRELINSGLNKFDDRPENYLAWKSSFINVLEGLSLTPSEELDLLIRWLGPQSSEQVKRVRAVHVADPAAGCRMVWSRLEESFGSVEIIEKTLFDKLDCFPKIRTFSPKVKITCRSSQGGGVSKAWRLLTWALLPRQRGVWHLLSKSFLLTSKRSGCPKGPNTSFSSRYNFLHSHFSQILYAGKPTCATTQVSRFTYLRLPL